MLDHFGLVVSDLEKAVRFYENSLAPLGLQIIERHDYGAVIFAKSAADEFPFIWIGTATPSFWGSDCQAGKSPVHWCFKAANEAVVNQFYKAAMANGGRCNGKAGPRGNRYYAAYVLDPDGNNIEVSYRPK